MTEHETSVLSSSSSSSSSRNEKGETSDDVVYLNNAGQSRLNKHVQDAGVAAVNRQAWEMNADQDQRLIRQLYARIIQADESDIAFMPSTAFAVSLVARNIEKHAKKSGRILLLQDQFSSAVYPWQDLCDSSNGNMTLDIVPYPDTDENSWTQAVLDRLDDGVIAACLPPLHWSDGVLLDLSTISDACRERGIWLIVDATQAVGAMPCTIPNIRPTFMACSDHKWLRSAPGVSLCYISPEVRSLWQPLDSHGRSRDLAGGSNWDAAQDTMGPKGYPEKFFDDARKFDSGGKPNPILLPMLRASLEHLVQLDFAQVQEQLRQLMMPLVDWALANEFAVTQRDRAYHIVGIRPLKLSTKEMIKVASDLQKEGIFVAVRCGAFRISPYIDTSEDDIQKLIDALSVHTNTY